MREKTFGSICFVLGLAILITTGTTFAYYNIVINDNNEEEISGDTFNFDATLDLNEVYLSNNLVPISSNLIATAISKEENKCIDKNGYDVCTLYEISLSNNGSPVQLNSYIKTTNSTFITNNLKCRLYNTSYEPISDIMTLSNTTNDKGYFQNNGDYINTILNSIDIEYYLVIWIEDTNDYQDDDYLKSYNGIVGFESLNEGVLTADITS